MTDTPIYDDSDENLMATPIDNSRKRWSQHTSSASSYSDEGSGSKKRRKLPDSIMIPASTMSEDEITDSDGQQLSLSEAQYKVLERLMKRENTFFTGAAGTGKSYCINVLESVLRKLDKLNVVARTAPTGVAACNISGMTIHSWAGVGLGLDSVENMAKKIQGRGMDAVRQRWKNTEILVIDEISMLGADLFEKISEVGKLVRGDPRPFGGIQVVMCGDFFQLPPVAQRGNDRPRFCFHIVLDKIFRQKDGPFVRVLNSIRRGIVTAEAEKILQQKLSLSLGDAELGFKHTVLFSRNKDCDDFNDKKLEKLPMVNKDESGDIISEDEEFVYVARDKNEEKFKGSKVPKQIELRVGAQVMLLKNLDQDSGLVNGSSGIVLHFEGDYGDKKMPVIEFTPVDFDVMNGTIVVASRTQIPLMLAWAVSIHKAQGCTLPFLELSFNGIFEYGQAYVALSRATDLTGLRIQSYSRNCIKVHHDVVKFYESMGCNTKDSEQIDDSLIATTVEALADKFVMELQQAPKRDSNEWLDGSSKISHNTAMVKRGEIKKGILDRKVQVPAGNSAVYGVYSMFARQQQLSRDDSQKNKSIPESRMHEAHKSSKADVSIKGGGLAGQNIKQKVKKEQPCEEYLMGYCPYKDDCEYLHLDSDVLAHYQKSAAKAKGGVASAAPINATSAFSLNGFQAAPPVAKTTALAHAKPATAATSCELTEEQRAQIQRNKEAALARRQAALKR
eukprot:GSChrysophyteH1.ASY1.ANO1.1807.1 assembled CDS